MSFYGNIINYLTKAFKTVQADDGKTIEARNFNDKMGISGDDQWIKTEVARDDSLAIEIYHDGPQTKNQNPVISELSIDKSDISSEATVTLKSYYKDEKGHVNTTKDEKTIKLNIDQAKKDLTISSIKEIDTADKNDGTRTFQLTQGEGTNAKTFDFTIDVPQILHSATYSEETDNLILVFYTENNKTEVSIPMSSIIDWSEISGSTSNTITISINNGEWKAEIIDGSVIHSKLSEELRNQLDTGDKIGRLQTNINNEEKRASKAEQILQDNIDTTNTNLSNEITRAEGEENKLDKKIDNEKTRAEDKENELQNAINITNDNLTSTKGELQTNINNEQKRAEGEEARIEGIANEAHKKIDTFMGTIESSTEVIDTLQEVIALIESEDAELSSTLLGEINSLKEDKANKTTVEDIGIRVKAIEDAPYTTQEQLDEVNNKFKNYTTTEDLTTLLNNKQDTIPENTYDAYGAAEAAQKAAEKTMADNLNNFVTIVEPTEEAPTLIIKFGIQEETE